MRSRTNKSSIKLNATEIKLTRLICFRMGKLAAKFTSISNLLYTANCSKIIYEIKFKYGLYSI